MSSFEMTYEIMQRVRFLRLRYNGGDTYGMVRWSCSAGGMAPSELRS